MCNLSLGWGRWDLGIDTRIYTVCITHSILAVGNMPSYLLEDPKSRITVLELIQIGFFFVIFIWWWWWWWYILLFSMIRFSPCVQSFFVLQWNLLIFINRALDFLYFMLINNYCSIIVILETWLSTTDKYFHSSFSYFSVRQTGQLWWCAHRHTLIHSY